MSKINKNITNNTNFHAGIKGGSKSEVKNMEETFKKFINTLKSRAEREVPEYGDFAMVYEKFENPEKDVMTATNFVIKISKPPKTIEGNEKIRNLEVTAYKLPSPYIAETIVETGTKDEILSKLQDPNIIKKIIEKAKSLSHELEDI